MLTTKKAWELKRKDWVVIKGEHYTLTEDPVPGPPGWTRLRCRDKQGNLIIHMVEGRDDVNVVRARDYTAQIRQGQRITNQRRRAK